jgi:hypothetical protein
MPIDWTVARALLTLVVFAAPSAASGQPPSEPAGPPREQPPAVEVTPYFGYGGDLNWLLHDHGAWSGSDAGHGTSAAFGARVAIRVSDALFVETAAGASEPGQLSDYHGAGPYGPAAGPTGPIAYANLTAVTYDVNVLYQLRDSEWAPFLTAGAGGVTTWPDRGSAWTDPSANLGVGLKIYVVPRLAFRMDVRGYIGRFRQMDSDGIVRSSGVTARPQISMGIGFGF